MRDLYREFAKAVGDKLAERCKTKGEKAPQVLLGGDKVENMGAPPRIVLWPIGGPYEKPRGVDRVYDHQESWGAEVWGTNYGEADWYCTELLLAIRSFVGVWKGRPVRRDWRAPQLDQQSSQKGYAVYPEFIVTRPVAEEDTFVTIEGLEPQPSEPSDGGEIGCESV
jgi:hypothetical protein